MPALVPVEDRSPDRILVLERRPNGLPVAAPRAARLVYTPGQNRLSSRLKTAPLTDPGAGEKALTACWWPIPEPRSLV